MFALFVLGGVVVPRALHQGLVYLIGRRLPRELSPDEWRQVWEEFFSLTYDVETAKHLSYCPPALYFLFWLTTVFAPFFILLIGFDQIAGEIQHRAIRYVAGRSRRESIVVGKALGVWAVISVMLLVLNVTVCIVMLATGAAEVGPVLSWGPRIWLFSVTACASFVGLTTLVSSLFRTPILGLFVGLVAFFFLWVANKILMAIKAAQPASWALPFRYEDLLLSHDGVRLLGGVGGYLAWGVLTIALAALVMKKRDI